MGRKRLEESEKKTAIKLSIKKKYIDELKAQDVNISKLFEDFILERLKS